MPILYHYTTIDVLQKIVESKCLWATSYRYLNDTEEIRHGLKIIKEYVRAENKKTSNEKAKNYLSAASCFLDSYPEIKQEPENDFYICSFSSAPDLLSQWRGYCPKSDGVCIGFYFDEQALNTLKKNRVTLKKCWYVSDPADLPISVFESVQKVIEAAQTNTTGVDKSFLKTAECTSAMVETAITIKHPSFEEEQESRLVWDPTGMKVESVFFRASHQTLIPFKKIELTSGDGEPVPIAGVIVGPSPKMKLTIASIQAFLNKNGVKVKREYLEDSPFETIVTKSSQEIIPASVIGSKIPYMNW